MHVGVMLMFCPACFSSPFTPCLRFPCPPCSSAKWLLARAASTALLVPTPCTKTLTLTVPLLPPSSDDHFHAFTHTPFSFNISKYLLFFYRFLKYCSTYRKGPCVLKSRTYIMQEPLESILLYRGKVGNVS